MILLVNPEALRFLVRESEKRDFDMTYIRDKLNEAKYFLDKMKQATSVPENFRYELNAFLAASRSIMQIMEKEFSKKPGFKDWYKLKQNGTLRYLHEQRDITIHRHPVFPCSVSIAGQSFNGTTMSIVLTGTDSSISLKQAIVILPVVQPNVPIVYYFNDISSNGKDVITICQEAIEVLETIVIECETKFNG